MPPAEFRDEPGPDPMGLMTMSDMDGKSVGRPCEYSIGVRSGGELTYGEFKSFVDCALPVELDASVLYSSMRTENLLSYSSIGRQGGWAMPALPKPSKMSTLQAFSGAFCSIGLES